MFTDITIFTYLRPVQFNVQILNGIKSPGKGFGLVAIKIPKANVIIPICPSYYIPQNPQNTIGQTALKSYNQFRSVRIKDIIWIQITTDTGVKLKVETTSKERGQQSLDFIIIDVIKIKYQRPSSRYIITLPITPIINSSFNKHPISW